MNILSKWWIRSISASFFFLWLVSHRSLGQETSFQSINHQGRIVVNGTNFQGNGQFKFALINGSGNIVWSNAAISNQEPVAAVTLAVSKGLYSLLLGDTTITNMAAIPSSVFDENRDLSLRVWFNDGVHGFQKITPDQRFATAPFAVIAARADQAVNFSGSLMGDVTGSQGLTAIAPATVTGKRLIGFSSGAGVITSADTILTAMGKLDGNLALKAPLASPGFTGTVQLSSGTAEIAPLKLASGTNLTNPQFGAIEFDGTNLYLTNNAEEPTRKMLAFTDGSIASATNFSGSLSGDVTGTQGATAIAATTVTGKALTGYASSTGTITASDSILSAIQKLNGNVVLRATRNSPTFTGTVQMPTGTATVAPLKMASGTNLATPQFGAIEFDGTNLYLTNNAATPTRKTIAFSDGTIASATNFSGNLSGDVTGSQSDTAIAATTVTGKVLTGYASTTGAISASDTILSAINKLNGNMALKANLASPTFTGTVSGITASMVGLGNVNNTSDANKPVSTAQQAALDLKAPLASPTFTGTVSGITASMVGLGNVNNTSDADKPISTLVQAALDGKQAVGSYATLVDGTIPAAQLPSYVDDVLEYPAFANFPIAGEGDKIYVDTSTSKIYRWSGTIYVEISPSPGTTDSVVEGSVNLYHTAARAAAAAPVQSVSGRSGNVVLSKTDVGLGNIDNTSDANKPVSTAQQTALNLKANLASPTFMGTVQLPTGTATVAPLKMASGTNLTTPVFGAMEFDGTNLYLTNNAATPTRKTIAFADGTIASATNFSGNLSGDVTGTQSATAIAATTVTGKVLTGYASSTGAISASDTILSAINKLNGNMALKANLASPTFTGTVSGITASMVGLGNVNNTSDANKPVSTAQQAALDLKAPLASPTFTGTVSGITASMVGLGNVTNTSDANKPVSTAQQAALDLKANLASPTFTGTVQLPTGTATVAPMKMASGTSLTTPEFGAMEFDGTNLYLTNNSATPTRKTIAFADGTIASAANFSGSLSGDVTGTQSSTFISATTVTGKLLTGYSSTTGTISASDTILSAIRKLNGNVALKANTASPTFTGTVSGITASMVGLGNVNNTADADKPVSTAQQTALDLKAPLASPTFTGTVNGITASMVGLGNVDNTSDLDKPISTAQLAALNAKAPIDSPTFTGTVRGITKNMVGLGSVTNTNDANKPVSIPQQAALDLKADLASPSFTGTVQLSSGTADIAPLKMASGTNLTTPVFGAIEFDGTNLYLTNNAASPTRKMIAFIDGPIVSASNFSGSLSGDVTGTQNNTVIAATTVTGKVLTGYASTIGVITASDTILTAINKLNGNVAQKANVASPTFTGTVSGITASMVGLGNVNNTSDANKPVSTAQQTALDLKAPLASPTFTGTVSGITASMVGLGNVNNTSDANKPVSTAQQTALNLKANLASPTFTGTVSGITASMVGLGNVNNTSDANKPVSAAQQTALNLKANLASPTFTGMVQLPAGTATVAPLKMATGTNLTTPVLGAMEFDGTNLYLTNNAASPTRKTIAFTDSAFSVSLSQLTAAPANPLLAWGSNSQGQSTVPTLANVTSVAAGETHTIALLSDGSVRSWGSMTTVPSTVTSVIAIAAGNVHNLVVKNDGTVVAWGGDDYGQSTVPAGINNATHVAAGEKHSLVLRSTGSVTAWGDNSFGQTTVPTAATTSVMAIAAGYDHCLALKSDGSVIAWGRNDAGQTDVPAGLTNVIAIAAGAYHSLAVKSDGTVVAWGWDSGGQSAVPAGLSGVSKVSGGYAFSAALKSDGSIVLWGDNTDAQTTLPATASQVTQISAGGYHMTALRSNAVPAQIARLDQDNALTGKLGVKRTAVNNTLEVEGNASKTTASNWLANSDRRIKTDIATISNGLQKINQVRLVDFRYTDDYLKTHPSIEDRKYLNVIAQEFVKVFPEHVKESGEFLPGGSPILQVDTYPLTIYSAAAIQELHQENTELKQRLSDQEARIRKLEALMENR